METTPLITRDQKNTVGFAQSSKIVKSMEELVSGDADLKFVIGLEEKDYAKTLFTPEVLSAIVKFTEKNNATIQKNLMAFDNSMTITINNRKKEYGYDESVSSAIEKTKPSRKLFVDALREPGITIDVFGMFLDALIATSAVITITDEIKARAASESSPITVNASPAIISPPVRPSITFKKADTTVDILLKLRTYRSTEVDVHYEKNIVSETV